MILYIINCDYFVFAFCALCVLCAKRKQGKISPPHGLFLFGYQDKRKKQHIQQLKKRQQQQEHNICFIA